MTRERSAVLTGAAQNARAVERRSFAAAVDVEHQAHEHERAGGVTKSRFPACKPYSTLGGGTDGSNKPFAW